MGGSSCDGRKNDNEKRPSAGKAFFVHVTRGTQATWARRAPSMFRASRPFFVSM